MNRIATTFRSRAAIRRAGIGTLKRPGLDYVTEARAAPAQRPPEPPAPRAGWLRDRWPLERRG